jgi:hypothetical protein
MSSNLLKKSQNLLMPFIVIITYFLFASPVFAQDPPKIEGSLITGWIQQIIDILAAVMVVSTSAMGLYGAYMWMTSTGDPGKVKSAQGTLTWAIIGLVFSLLIRSIVALLFEFLSHRKIVLRYVSIFTFIIE